MQAPEVTPSSKHSIAVALFLTTHVNLFAGSTEGAPVAAIGGDGKQGVGASAKPLLLPTNQD